MSVIAFDTFDVHKIKFRIFLISKIIMKNMFVSLYNTRLNNNYYLNIKYLLIFDLLE